MYNTSFVSKTFVMKFVLSALLVFAHLVYAFYSWLADRIAFGQSDPWRDQPADSHVKCRLSRTPNHLVVSVCQEEVFYEYLAKMLAWALFLDVPVVSFYHNENGTIYIRIRTWNAYSVYLTLTDCLHYPPKCCFHLFFSSRQAYRQKNCFSHSETSTAVC